VFITVRHEVSDEGGLVLSDEHDIVFRGAGGSSPPPVPAPAGEAWRREIRPDPLLLFRYSAVTFNGHRIHYDQPYATTVEGYPGLVVHGPLIATLLVDLLRRHRPHADLRGYAFKAMRPLFDTASFDTCGAPLADGRSARLWTRDVAGAITMDATATW
jgi:3-methylfumaryl-CoA hydratase